MELGHITFAYIESAFRRLQEDFVGRNDRMDAMEELYQLDMWSDSPVEDEIRVSSPRAWFTVERYRSLLLTERPIIQVPEATVKKKAQQVADQIEKYLYGAWDQMQMLSVLSEAEWNAVCLGTGILRVTYDPRTPEGDFPLIAQALDPRNCYWNEGVRRPNEDVEFIHVLRRSRRNIEEEWGEVFDDKPLPGQEREDWLDTLVDYYDYWKIRVVQEEKPPEPELPAEGSNVMRRLYSRAQEQLKALRGEEREKIEEEEPEDIWRRKVINAVAADGKVIKGPRVMHGYERLPFLRWSGIRTGMSGKDKHLSALYPLTAGENFDDETVMGVLGGESTMLSIKAIIAQKYANAALITNDPGLSDLDARPGAINVSQHEDPFVEWAQPPGTHRDVDELSQQLAQLAEQSSLPKAMHGQYVGELSGVAMSLLINPVLTQIADRQRERELAWERMNKVILMLTEAYAPDEGWAVLGEDERGVAFEERLSPWKLGAHRHNRVMLSASLPKDREALTMVIQQLVRDMLLSRRTAIEQIQEILGHRGRTPSDELQQILYESILYGNEQAKNVLAQATLQQVDEELAIALQSMAEQGQQPGPPAQGPPGPTGRPQPAGAPGAGPMEGQPPENLPPEFVGGGGRGEERSPRRGR